MSRYARASVSVVRIVGSCLVLVVVLHVWRRHWSLFVRFLGLVCSFVRRLASLDPVAIWRKSAKLASRINNAPRISVVCLGPTETNGWIVVAESGQTKCATSSDSDIGSVGRESSFVISRTFPISLVGRFWPDFIRDIPRNFPNKQNWQPHLKKLKGAASKIASGK